MPNNPIQIADAALYLMKSQPKLGITDPYEPNLGTVHGDDQPASRGRSRC